MKKILFAIAAVAALASCSKNEADNNAAGQKAIAFSNLNDKVNSRAANDAGSDYKVYAKSSLAGENAWFINDVIDGTTNMAENGPYYWPASATVNFYAYAPATAGLVADTYPSTLAVAYSVPAAADEDFTVATNKTGLSSGTVDFEFSHMLSKVSFNAALTQELQDAGYTMTFASADLTVVCNSAVVDLVAANLTWIWPNSTVGTTYSGAKSYMVMPQSVTGCTAQIKGVVISKGGAEVFSGDLKIFTQLTSEMVSFDKGNHYMLNFIVGSSSTDDNGDPILGDEILFSADLAADWDTVAGIDTPIAQP